jgi:hypothetical protein
MRLRQTPESTHTRATRALDSLHETELTETGRRETLFG